MRHFSRTLLLLISCVVAIHAFAISENKKAGEDFDFEFDDFAGESSASSSSSSEEGDEELEPHAEMLPANFENVEPPGVDHMELTKQPVPNPNKMMREYNGKMVEV